MKERNLVVDLSEEFAVKICKFYRFLTEERHERVISTQLLRSGTSIGANIAESQFAESIDDFIHKLNISRKEANETLYWLRILYKSNQIHETDFRNLSADCDAIIRLLSRIVLTTKNNSTNS